MVEENKFEDMPIEKEDIDSHLNLSNLDHIEEGDGVNIHCINSTEFVVGRQTNFNGPVTIINCLNDSFKKKSLPKNYELEKIVIKDKILTESATATMDEYAKKKSTENFSKSAVDPKKKTWCLFQENLFTTRKCIWLFLAIILGIVICFSVIFFKPLNNEYDRFKEDNKSICQSYNSTDKDFCFYSKFDRNDWYSLNKIYLQKPFKKVVISHTDAESCFYFNYCISIVETIYKFDINNISYCHFYVGGDGNFYESLSKHLTENSTLNESINICLIGSFSKINYPTYPQIKAIKKFLHFGIENNLLAKDYVIVPGNSIVNLDDESSLYNIIKKWSNFKSDMLGEDAAQNNENTNFKIYYKKDWNGLPAKSFVEMKLPVPYVVISHSVTSQCFNLRTCSPLLKNIQNYHFSKSFADIAYNFLVDSNGNIYEGRGWKNRNVHLNFVDGRNIGINFIGDYSTNITPTKYQFDGVKRLIQYGTNNYKISQNYSLVAANATYNTLSPGKNVYKVIKSWPHFDPDPELHVKEFDDI